MNAKDVKAIILDCNDDSYGLYEIIWSLNSIFPNESTTTKISLSQPVLLSLLNERIAQLCLANWDTREEQQVEPSNYEKIINNFKSWEPPSELSPLYYSFYITEP